jgi:adenosylhomocysteinase
MPAYQSRTDEGVYAMPESRIRYPDLAPQGEESIYMAESRMPTLRRLRKRFSEEKPLSGMKIGACLHVTRETAVLARTLAAGGAEIALAGSNPLSTQDDVASALAEEGFHVFAWRGNDREYYDCLKDVLGESPDILIDDGADLIVTAHNEKSSALARVIGAQEETTTGVHRLRAMEKRGALRIPVIAVNDARTKMMFDNYYGTGQGVVSAIAALDILFAGKTIVVAGYGNCSRGMATRSRGLGANVIVTEVDPIRALQAVMDGFRVMPMSVAAPLADVLFTATGCIDVVGREEFQKMKDGVILANLGHFNVEVSVKDLESLAKNKRKMREYVDEYVLHDGRRLYLLAEGRLANLVVLGGHPAEIMDLSFSVQALASEYLARNKGSLEVKVHDIAPEVDSSVARVKLETLGVDIDKLSEKQKIYVEGFEMGT